MTIRRVMRRKRARSDIEDTAQHYTSEAGTDLALRFAAAVEDAIRHIATYPRSGSPRYAHLLRADDLRFWPVKGFPYLVFHAAVGADVDVWRVLHAERDIPAWLREEKS